MDLAAAASSQYVYNSKCILVFIRLSFMPLPCAKSYPDFSKTTDLLVLETQVPFFVVAPVGAIRLIAEVHKHLESASPTACLIML